MLTILWNQAGFTRAIGSPPAGARGPWDDDDDDDDDVDEDALLIIHAFLHSNGHRKAALKK